MRPFVRIVRKSKKGVSLVEVFVDNALKYGGEALSEISIKYKGSDKYHIISIKDNGIGLKEQDSHQDIFAPFIRRKTSKGIQGSGLGLNILKEIAEKHGGEAWLELGQERGITFYISIPKNLQPALRKRRTKMKSLYRSDYTP